MSLGYGVKSTKADGIGMATCKQLTAEVDDVVGDASRRTETEGNVSMQPDHGEYLGGERDPENYDSLNQMSNTSQVPMLDQSSNLDNSRTSKGSKAKYRENSKQS